MLHRIYKRVGLTAVLIFALAALTGAAAAPSAPSKAPPPSPLKRVLAQLNGLSLKAREARLLQLAKAEGGELEFYTSLSTLISRPLVEEFQKAYPDIKINLYRASSEDLAQRILQEARAGRAGADVIETNGTEMSFFQHRKDILVPYRGSPYAKQVPAQYRFDTFTAARLEAFVVAWNTNLVRSGEEPRRITDLAQDKWKGKLSMEPTDIDWYAGVYQTLEKEALAKIKFKQRGRALAAAKRRALARIRSSIDATFRRIAANSRVTSGHTTQANLLAAGQFAVCVSCHAQSIEQLKARRAPITFGAPFARPVIIRPQGMGIAYRLRHPATALLFYDWMLAPHGQRVLKDNGSEPSRVGFEDEALRGAPVVKLNLRPIISRFGFWSDKYDALMRAAGGS